MLSTGTLININIRAQARTQRFIIVPGVREWELMDVNFYVNKAIREICCCYCWFLLYDITQHSARATEDEREKKLLCIWKEMTLLLIIPRDFLITQNVIKLNRNFYFAKLNFQEIFFLCGVGIKSSSLLPMVPAVAKHCRSLIVFQFFWWNA